MKRWIVVAVSVLALVACGDDTEGSSASPDSTPQPSTSEAEIAPETTTTTPTSNTTEAPAESMRGKRYCEVLLLGPTPSGIEATVFNSFPMGDCPDDQWRELDGDAIAVEQGAALALLNGPRFWLMDNVERGSSDVISVMFGRIEMNRYATVSITDPTTIGRSYSPQTVDRKSTFVFRSGQTIFRLTADDGRQFAMQSWSQQVDATLSEADLADLGRRLQLPAGWIYEAVPLTTDLVIGASAEPAQVLQDEFLNSYSLID